MSFRKNTLIICAILLVYILLSVYGIQWGLPDRWNADEEVARTLRLIHLKSIFAVVNTTHPQLYNFVLAIPLAFYLIILKLANYPLQTVISAASKSWIHLSVVDPEFATVVYIIARSFSAILGLGTIILTYLIAKLLYNKKVGLFSAAILSLSLGLVEISHFAKHTALVLPLVLLVIYLCIKGLKQGGFERYFLYASFVSGLAISTKYDGGLSLMILISSYIIWFRTNKKIVVGSKKLIFFSVILVILGFLFGWPAFLKNLSLYINNVMGNFPHFSFSLIPILAKKIYFNIRHIIVMFGLPMGIFVYAGILHFIVSFKKHSYGLIFASMLVPYFLLNVIYFIEYPGASTKLLIQAVPILSIFAACAIDNFLNSAGFVKILNRVVISVVFLLTFIYTFRADMLFAYKDTRYESSKWILNNIPITATIEHVQEVDLLFSAKLSLIYNVKFYGRNSKSFSGNSFYKIDDQAIATEYLVQLDREGSSADYFIVAFGKDFKKDISDMPKGSENQFCYRLFLGKDANFKLVKRFHYPESLFFNPRPSYTAPDIYIFRRVRSTK